MTENQWAIRPARLQDQESVFDFAARNPEDEDSIQEVWDEWLADPNGPLLVGTLDGEPVALVKLSDQGEGESWIHGLHVAKDSRSRGFGLSMIQYCQSLAAERGDSVVRLMAGEENRAMQHVAESAGFNPVVSASWFKASPEEGYSALVPLDEMHFDWLAEQLGSSPLLAQTGQLYSFRWQFQLLTRSRLLEHLRSGEVFSIPGADAWAIVDLQEPWLGFAYGPEKDLTRLLQELLTYPTLSEDEELVALVPPASRMAHLLLKAGFQQDGRGERCYEWEPQSPAKSAP